jgi:hypothetical protein
MTKLLLAILSLLIRAFEMLQEQSRQQRQITSREIKHAEDEHLGDDHDAARRWLRERGKTDRT